MESEDNAVTIVTHNGSFHADDVFAVAIMRVMFPDARIVRTRNEELIRKADFRVDVGFRNDPETNDFDHHQEEGAGKRDNGVPYAACGLVWKHFGEKVCGSRSVADDVDARLIQPIDAIDSGVSFPPIEGTSIVPFTVSDVVELMNLTWLEKTSVDDRFLEAVDYASLILRREIAHAKAREESKKIVDKALADSTDSPVVELPHYCPWKHVLCATDKLFVIFPTLGGLWTLYSIPKSEGSFENKRLLPAAWAGKTNGNFEKASGVKDVVFCHKSLFIATAKTREAILKLVDIALQD